MFTIATYNILADAYVKPSRYPHSTPDDLDPARREALLFETIANLDADVLALQEVEDARLDRLVGYLSAGNGPVHVHHAPRAAKPDGVTIISRLPFIETTTLPFDADDAGAYERVSALARVEVDGHTVGIASTHLRWQGREVSPAKHQGRRQLVALLDALDGDIPWVVCGDFNANSQSTVLQAAYDRGWELSCRAQRPWDTVNMNGRRRKIDYLLYRSDELTAHPGRLLELGRDTPMPSPTHASDHQPVAVGFEVR